MYRYTHHAVCIMDMKKPGPEKNSEKTRRESMPLCSLNISRDMEIVPEDPEIFCSKPFTDVNPISRPLPHSMNSSKITLPPRAMTFTPPKKSSATWIARDAFETPPLVMVNALSHTSGWP